MKNRLFTASLLLLLALALALPCAAEAGVPDASLPAFTWDRNGTDHWHVLPNGERENVAAHTLDGVVCTVCGSEVWAFDDGSADVSDYDEQGSLVRYTSFDENSEVTIELLYTYDYDDEGRMLAAREFSGDMLIGEVTYAVGENGEPLPVSQVAYYDDDTWAVSEYDALGNLVRAVTYDTDGTVAFEEVYEYALNADGHYYEAKKTSRLADGETFYHEYNEYGDTTRSLSTDADGSVWEDAAYEYHYENGMMLSRRQYTGGQLSTETLYNEEGFAVMETEYYDDGATMVTQYNDFTDPVTITFYAADGSVEAVQTYEYEYAEDMSWLVTRAYMDGALVIQTEYASNGAVSRETVYDDDGSRTVYEFNADEEIISETNYDAQGNVIQ